MAPYQSIEIPQNRKRKSEGEENTGYVHKKFRKFGTKCTDQQRSVEAEKEICRTPSPSGSTSSTVSDAGSTTPIKQGNILSANGARAKYIREIDSTDARKHQTPSAKDANNAPSNLQQSLQSAFQEMSSVDDSEKRQEINRKVFGLMCRMYNSEAPEDPGCSTGGKDIRETGISPALILPEPSEPYITVSQLANTIIRNLIYHKSPDKDGEEGEKRVKSEPSSPLSSPPSSVVPRPGKSRTVSPDLCGGKARRGGPTRPGPPAGEEQGLRERLLRGRGTVYGERQGRAGPVVRVQEDTPTYVPYPKPPLIPLYPELTNFDMSTAWSAHVAGVTPSSYGAMPNKEGAYPNIQLTAEQDKSYRRMAEMYSARDRRPCHPSPFYYPLPYTPLNMGHAAFQNHPLCNTYATGSGQNRVNAINNMSHFVKSR